MKVDVGTIIGILIAFWGIYLTISAKNKIKLVFIINECKPLNIDILNQNENTSNKCRVLLTASIKNIGNLDISQPMIFSPISILFPSYYRLIEAHLKSKIGKLHTAKNTIIITIDLLKIKEVIAFDFLIETELKKKNSKNIEKSVYKSIQPICRIENLKGIDKEKNTTEIFKRVAGVLLSVLSVCFLFIHITSLNSVQSGQPGQPEKGIGSIAWSHTAPPIKGFEIDSMLLAAESSLSKDVRANKADRIISSKIKNSTFDSLKREIQLEAKYYDSVRKNQNYEESRVFACAVDSLHEFQYNSLEIGKDAKMEKISIFKWNLLLIISTLIIYLCIKFKIWLIRKKHLKQYINRCKNLIHRDVIMKFIKSTYLFHNSSHIIKMRKGKNVKILKGK